MPLRCGRIRDEGARPVGDGEHRKGIFVESVHSAACDVKRTGQMGISTPERRHCGKGAKTGFAPRRLPSPCHPHTSRTSQRHQVPRPTRSRHSVLLSLIFRWASLVMSVHRLCHCAVCLQHTTLPQQTPLRNSPSRSFCSCVLPNTPFRRTVPFLLHEDLREAQTSSNTGNLMEVTFADAATQLSFAEFFERCILSRALPPRPQPTPHFASRCIYSGFPTQCRFLRCIHPTPAHRVLSSVRLLQ